MKGDICRKNLVSIPNKDKVVVLLELGRRCMQVSIPNKDKVEFGLERYI